MKYQGGLLWKISIEEKFVFKPKFFWLFSSLNCSKWFGSKHDFQEHFKREPSGKLDNRLVNSHEKQGASFWSCTRIQMKTFFPSHNQIWRLKPTKNIRNYCLINILSPTISYEGFFEKNIFSITIKNLFEFMAPKLTIGFCKNHLGQLNKHH